MRPTRHLCVLTLLAAVATTRATEPPTTLSLPSLGSPCGEAIQQFSWLKGDSDLLAKTWGQVSAGVQADIDRQAKDPTYRRTFRKDWEDALAAAIADKPRPGLLDNLKAPLFTPEAPWAYEKDPRWPAGNGGHRDMITRQLFSLGKKAVDNPKSTEAEKEVGRRRARLALALAAHEGYPNGDGTIVYFFRQDPTNSILALTPAEREIVQKQTDAVLAASKRLGSHDLFSAAKMLDGFIANHDTLTPEARTDYQARCLKAWTDMRGYSQFQSGEGVACGLLLKYACLVHALSKPEMTAEVEATAAKMKASAADPFAQAWVSAIAEARGPVPKSSGWKVVSNEKFLKNAKTPDGQPVK